MDVVFGKFLKNKNWINPNQKATGEDIIRYQKMRGFTESDLINQISAEDVRTYVLQILSNPQQGLDINNLEHFYLTNNDLDEDLIIAEFSNQNSHINKEEAREILNALNNRKDLDIGTADLVGDVRVYPNDLILLIPRQLNIPEQRLKDMFDALKMLRPDQIMAEINKQLPSDSIVIYEVGGKNAAQVAKTKEGGISFNADKMNLEVKGNSKDARQVGGAGIKFNMDPAMLKRLQEAPGFFPVIISIEPMADVRLFLGLTVPKQDNSVG